jgi:Putative HNHc nuclease
MMQRRPRRENLKHLRFVSGRPCIICGSSPCDAAHIKFADARVLKPQSSNIGMKADDRFSLPLCRHHHDQQHAMPERKFWQHYHTDPILMSLALYSISGDEQEGDRLIQTQVYTLQVLGVSS